MPGPPDNPLCIRHVSMCEYPPSPTYPGGQAISALNPNLGIKRHKSALHGYAILNILRPNLDLLPVVSDAPTDPEPPI